MLSLAVIYLFGLEYCRTGGNRLSVSKYFFLTAGLAVGFHVISQRSYLFLMFFHS